MYMCLLTVECTYFRFYFLACLLKFYFHTFLLAYSSKHAIIVFIFSLFLRVTFGLKYLTPLLGVRERNVQYAGGGGSRGIQVCAGPKVWPAAPRAS